MDTRVAFSHFLSTPSSLSPFPLIFLCVSVMSPSLPLSFFLSPFPFFLCVSVPPCLYPFLCLCLLLLLPHSCSQTPWLCKEMRKHRPFWSQMFLNACVLMTGDYVRWRTEGNLSCLKWEKVIGKMGFVLSNISLSRHPLRAGPQGLPETNCIFSEGVWLTSAPWGDWLRRALKTKYLQSQFWSPWKWPHKHCF